MPTPLGPRFFSAALNFSAMMSKASSHETGVNSPFLSYLPFGLAQHRLGEAVMAVHDLGKEIALHAIQSAIDFGLDVAMGCDHAIVLGGDHHAAAGAAEPARRLVPLQFAGGALGDEVGGDARSTAFRRRVLPSRRPRASEPGGGRAWVRSWQFSRSQVVASMAWKDERGGIDVGQQRELVEGGPERAGIRRVDHDDELALGIAAIDLASVQGQNCGFDARRGAPAAPAPECWRFRRRAELPRGPD